MRDLPGESTSDGDDVDETTRAQAIAWALNVFLISGSRRAGDRTRTGDVQLGKLIDEGPEDYDPWA